MNWWQRGRKWTASPFASRPLKSTGKTAKNRKSPHRPISVHLLLVPHFFGNEGLQLPCCHPSFGTISPLLQFLPIPAERGPDPSHMLPLTRLSSVASLLCHSSAKVSLSPFCHGFVLLIPVFFTMALISLPIHPL
jgi:hypothetical protein